MLADRDVLVVPDVLADAGGVTASYDEWAVNMGRHDGDDVESSGATRRSAAAAIALDRVLFARRFLR